MIIGIEGVSCVGKTTLAAALADLMDDPLIVPCYYHSAPDPARLPPPVTDTASEQLENLSVFLRIEELRRTRALQAAGQGRDVILDRTLDTLLAHTHAVGRVGGFDCDAAARRMIRQHSDGLPDLTILLHAHPDVVQRRAALRPGMPAIFYDLQFTSYFHEYFRRPQVPLCVALDAGVTPADLAQRALDQIRHRRSAALVRSTCGEIPDGVHG
ncbi:MAG: hypothetical protein ACRDTT_26425, partial [Pseudonocardiaceae bacterium]